MAALETPLEKMLASAQQNALSFKRLSLLPVVFVLSGGPGARRGELSRRSCS
ncbi:hypothetical protein KW851_09285 [Pseudomonas sp. PDM33]|uniref:hypothetical protein n=1 Tax=unclassified Pseudomonas TaxID=196821 RepID=UPI0012E0BD82|nr:MULTISPECIES: hypothetical protein [unclassified Pseudomonas]MBV7583010.1 hypothetical protein [Pseudomonas sp. PDM33]